MNKDREISRLEGHAARLERKRTELLQQADDLLRASNFSAENVVALRRSAQSLEDHIAVARERIAVLRAPLGAPRQRPETSQQIIGERLTL